MKKIIEKVFRLKHGESVCCTINPNGNRVEYKIDHYTLWKPDIVPNYKIDKKNNPEYYSATFFNSIPLSIEDDPATYSVKHEDWIAKSYFDLFESMHLESIYSSNQSRDRKKYNIKSSVWADLLDFDYIDSEQLASIESILKRNFNGKRGGYNLYEYKCGENIISLICYLNDLERENYFKMKYDRTLIIYTLNKMTQWITPFTTPTEQNVFPAYNPDLVFTCHFYNHASNGYGKFRWRELDFEANLIEKYRDISYKKFISWYDATSASDKKRFDDQIEKYTKEIFYSFIYCPTDYIYFPINRSSIAPVDFKTNPIKDSKTDCLGFYYCLCDRFYYHIGPQITQSFIQTCEEWINNNDIWSEFKKIYEEKRDFNLFINSKEYSGERSSERLAEDLEQILGNALGRYLGEHLDEYLDKNGDKYWEMSVDYYAFGGRLISENINEIIEKFKKNLSQDPKLDYLYIIFSKIKPFKM